MRRESRHGVRGTLPAGSGLVPTVIQDATDGRVLGLAYSSPASWRKVQPGGPLILFSRRRNRLWRKGETSGNTARVVSTAVDCDRDAYLVRVERAGPYCHTGSVSCFVPDPDAIAPPDALRELERVIQDRKFTRPRGSYTVELFRDEERRLKKVGEEATEVVVAASRRDREAVVRESRDLLYHLLVVLSSLDIPWDQVTEGMRPSPSDRRRPRAVAGARPALHGAQRAPRARLRPRSRTPPAQVGGRSRPARR